jgi:uncharacterized membrane protein required for colicin V production
MDAENVVQQADTVIKGMSLTNFDIIIFVIIGLSILIAVFRGFVKSFISSVGWILSLIIALYFHEIFSPLFAKYTASKSLADLLGFASVFLVASIIIAVINGIIITLLKGVCGGILDRSCGLFFGFIRGCLLVSVMFYIMVLLIPALSVKDHKEITDSEKLPKWAKNSQSLLLLSRGANFIALALPEHFQENLKMSLSEHRIIADTQDKDDEQSSDYVPHKPKAPVEKIDRIKSMNVLLSSLPKEVLDETAQDDLFVLQDSLADPSIKVQILEKIANNYQKYINDATNAEPTEQSKEQNKEYNHTYSLIEDEISKYNEMINATTE